MYNEILPHDPRLAFLPSIHMLLQGSSLHRQVSKEQDVDAAEGIAQVCAGSSGMVDDRQSIHNTTHT